MQKFNPNETLQFLIYYFCSALAALAAKNQSKVLLTIAEYSIYICRKIMTTTPKNVKLADVDVLSRPNCKIKEPERVEKLINSIINGGPSQLQIVTDFDYTLTKQKTDNGKPILSSFGMFNKCKSLPSSYLDESDKLYHKYRPIEICPKMSHDEKVQHMIDWWRLSADLLK